MISTASKQKLHDRRIGLKLRPSYLLIYLLCALLPILAYSEDTKESKRLKVGVITALSGGISVWGQSVSAAIELANSESPKPAELFFEDEEICLPMKALTAFTRLTTLTEVDLIVASCLEGGQAIAPLAKRKNIPFFISGRSATDFQESNPNALSWLSLLDDEGEDTAQLILKNKWKRGTAVVWSTYFGVHYKNGIEKALKKHKSDFLLEALEVNPSSALSGAEVQLALRKKPEVIFLMLSEAAAASVVKRLRAHKYNGVIILQSSMLQTYDPLVREVFVGTLQQKFPTNSELYPKVREKLVAKFGSQIADDFVFSYDGFKIVLEQANACVEELNSGANQNLEACLTKRLRTEEWRDGASGKFRFMKDGSTQRKSEFKKVTLEGYE